MSLLEVEGLTLDVPVDSGNGRILHGVDLTVEAGSAMGIVGESGSGKSMTVRTVAALLPPGATTSGTVSFEGEQVTGMSSDRLRRYRSSQVAMIFQDPRAAINPVRKVGNFLIENAVTNLGWSRSRAREKAIEVLREVGINDPERRLDAFPSELSGGLLQRVMIASTLLYEPQLLLADEPTTALDVTTQSAVMALIDRLRRERGMAMVFVTHDLELAAAVCDTILVMYAGRIVEKVPASELHERSRHPYTRALLDARPRLDGRESRLRAIPGQPLSGLEDVTGCAFAARCPFALDICRTDDPPVVVVDDGEVRCHRVHDQLWEVS
ncbi:MAG TPA: ABC transporter ATP-binding protein [Actinobacteria bacterium]|jgi:oligopeptide/dipeptide ABC transporter ATP-binding protein|nr:ABC transporter ATP-binding protein [Actinomycetota bacterium]